MTKHSDIKPENKDAAKQSEHKEPEHKPEAPKEAAPPKEETKAKAKEAAPLPPPPEPTVFDPQCAEQRRHYGNCGCKGDARKPFA